MQGNFGYSSTTRLDFEAAALLMSKPFGPMDLSSIQDHQHNRANLVSKLVTQGDGKQYSKEPYEAHTPAPWPSHSSFDYLAHELLRQMERNAKTYVIHEKKVIITHLISRDYFKDLSSLVQRYMDSVRITVRFLLLQLHAHSALNTTTGKFARCLFCDCNNGRQRLCHNNCTIKSKNR